jgi:hypothetical protein
MEFPLSNTPSIKKDIAGYKYQWQIRQLKNPLSDKLP